MTHDPLGGEATGRAHLLEEEQVRGEFNAAGHSIWIGLAGLLGRRWDSQALAHRAASRIVGELSDLAKLRCLPDARPIPASSVLDELYERVSRYGRTPRTVVESHLVRRLAGEPRNLRTTAEVTELIEALLRRYAADYERGELTWVDELYAMATPGNPVMTWRLEVPPAHAAGEDAMVTLRVPVAALEAAGLSTGDQLILEPRWDGLWIGGGPPSAT
ncbi:hypothetical protein JMJ56_24630 [Belnapia sp. T18]|uniref:Uncharacterized protein n=1 Tax=Belnapia arida TaxID=2804533 RepID=A0ABS1UAP3_9PROT|nr:hypothetical protein [Belnapia arida]MBL6081190.1 hypothetical protein [Belnapia arida]